jgi:ubiquinone/menaquinone biosynthesis C-methylase UbiE
MTLDEIRMNWTNKCKDRKAAVKMWDSMAGQFKRFEITGNESILLKIIERENMLQSDSRVLDVGCGTGRYSAALSKIVLGITGIDLSPKMIELGKENIEKLGIKNVSLICGDWSEFCTIENGFENIFDLVFAHMTPAITDAGTFEKMIRCSKNCGIVVKPTRRTDEISDEIMKMMEIYGNTFERDESIAYAFSMLWLMGYQPKLEYEEQEWNTKKSFEEACGMYINRVKTYKNISKDEEEKIEHFLRSKLKDGFIEEKVNTTVSVLYWRK